MCGDPQNKIKQKDLLLQFVPGSAILSIYLLVYGSYVLHHALRAYRWKYVSHYALRAFGGSYALHHALRA